MSKPGRHPRLARRRVCLTLARRRVCLTPASNPLPLTPAPNPGPPWCGGRAGRRLCGVPDAENFDTGDLFDGSNMKQALICLHSLARRAKKDAAALGFPGPHLGAAAGGEQASPSAGGGGGGGKVRALSKR